MTREERAFQQRGQHRQSPRERVRIVQLRLYREAEGYETEAGSAETLP